MTPTTGLKMPMWTTANTYTLRLLAHKKLRCQHTVGSHTHDVMIRMSV